MNSLAVPPAAQRDQNSIQMLSAWIAENGLHCSLKLGMWQSSGTDEPHAWGILLADIIRHIANGHREQFGRDPFETIQDVLASLNRELDEPSSKASGGFHAGPN